MKVTNLFGMDPSALSWPNLVRILLKISAQADLSLTQRETQETGPPTGAQVGEHFGMAAQRKPGRLLSKTVPMVPKSSCTSFATRHCHGANNNIPIFRGSADKTLQMSQETRFSRMRGAGFLFPSRGLGAGSCLTRFRGVCAERSVRECPRASAACSLGCGY